MNKFEILEIIGEGTYGIVVKALNKETNQIVAIKKFKENAKDFIKRELKMLNSLRTCEFIINLKEAYRRKEKVYFIFEYIERTLLHLLQENPNGLKMDLTKNLLFQLCKAVEKCHSLDIIHRDIKPENLLIDKNNNLKLCDFGFARSTNDDEGLTEYVATRWYRSPELVLYCPYSKPIDVWAIGCISCECANGKPIFPGSSNLDQIHRIISLMGPLPDYQIEKLRSNGGYFNLKFNRSDKSNTFEKIFQNYMDDKLLDFTLGCLMLNPKNRLSVFECLAHPVFESQLKNYINKKLDRRITSSSPLKFREYDNDGREVKSRRSFNANETLPYSTSKTTMSYYNNDNYDDLTSSTHMFGNQNSNASHSRLGGVGNESRLRTSHLNNPNTTTASQSTSNEKKAHLSDDERSSNGNKLIHKYHLNNAKSSQNLTTQEATIQENNNNNNKQQHLPVHKYSRKSRQFYDDVFNSSSSEHNVLNPYDSMMNNFHQMMSKQQQQQQPAQHSSNEFKPDSYFHSKMNSNRKKNLNMYKRSKSTLEDHRNDFSRERMRKASITPTKNYENFSLLNASSQSIKNLTEPVQSSKDKNLNILKLLTRKNTSFDLANYNRHNDFESRTGGLIRDSNKTPTQSTSYKHYYFQPTSDDITKSKANKFQQIANNSSLTINDLNNVNSYIKISNLKPPGK